MKGTALLIIDVQKGFDDPCWGKRNNPDAESNTALLLSKWRKKGLPVVHIQHCSVGSNSPLQPEFPGNEFNDEALPIAGGKLLTKTVNSALIETELEGYPRSHGINYLAEDIQKIHLASLNDEFCVIRSTLNEIA